MLPAEYWNINIIKENLKQTLSRYKKMLQNLFFNNMVSTEYLKKILFFQFLTETNIILI